MSKHSLLILPLLLGGVAAANSPWTAQPAADAVLKDKEHEDVGELISDWLLVSTKQHKNRKLTILDAKQELAKQLEKWGKKRELDGRAPLSLTEDLGASLWYSMGYDKAKGIKKGKIAEIETTNANGDEIEYAFWAPSKYRAASGPYPLILCIAGEGESPTDHLTEKWIDPSIRDGAILACVPMPEDLAEWTTTRQGLANFFAVFKDVTEKYAVDFDRLYVAGRGVGVATGMEIVSYFPDRFAGVIGRTGDAAEIGPESFYNLPTFFAGAGKAASEFQAACKAAGSDNVTLEPAGQEPEVWAWIQANAREANPLKVTLRPGQPFANSAYWLKVPATDVETMVTAEIDRAANSVTIDAIGVPKVYVSFNDLLLDLDKPVKVIVNGAVHDEVVSRSLDTFLERVLQTSNDPGKLYTSTRSYDVPVAKAADDAEGGGDAAGGGGQ